jgi:hypothetical protein
MPTPATERPGMGAAAKRVAEHASALARLELELAGLEVKGKVAALGTGVGIGIAAALFAVFALAFALAAGAAALALVLDTWLSLLVVAGALLLLALILGFVALRAIRRGSPPVPEQAIEEARRTTAALREDGHA